MNEDKNTERARQEGRFRAVAVRTQILADVFRGGCFFKSDLPEDIEVDHVYHDPNRNGLIVVLVSERFDPVPCGTEIPGDAGVETFYLEHIDNEEN